MFMSKTRFNGLNTHKAVSFSPFTLREVCAYNSLELLALGFNPGWPRSAARRWDAGHGESLKSMILPDGLILNQLEMDTNARPSCGYAKSYIPSPSP
jgi:hypothetical protein